MLSPLLSSFLPFLFFYSDSSLSSSVRPLRMVGRGAEYIPEMSGMGCWVRVLFRFCDVNWGQAFPLRQLHTRPHLHSNPFDLTKITPLHNTPHTAQDTGMSVLHASISQFWTELMLSPSNRKGPNDLWKMPTFKNEQQQCLHVCFP